MSRALDPMDVDGVMQAVATRLRDSIPIESDGAVDADGAVARMRGLVDRLFAGQDGDTHSLQRWRSSTYSVPVKREYT
ncbi:hypothetical protein AB4084_30435, partial [Lysobacter sp. 2RAB21]